MRNSRFDIAVSLALDVLHDEVRLVSDMMQKVAEQHCNPGIYNALNLADVTRERIEDMRERSYAGYDAVSVDLAILDSLMVAIASAVTECDDILRRALDGCAHYLCVLMHMVELAENGEEGKV